MTYSFYQNRKKHEKQKLKDKQGLLFFDEDSIITIADIRKDPSIPNINWKEIELLNRIGRGASGLVWSGKWNRFVLSYFYNFIFLSFLQWKWRRRYCSKRITCWC